jgi:putative transposase
LLRLCHDQVEFKLLQAAKTVLSGIELMHMIREGQSYFSGSDELSFADQFYALVGEIRLL